MPGIRQRVYEIVEPAEPDDQHSRWLDRVIIALILASVAVTIAESEQTIADRIGMTLFVLDKVIVSVFIIEYVLRVWTCILTPGYVRPVIGRLRYMTRPLMLIDLVAILPSLISPGLGDLRVLRALRLLRLLKVGRYSESARLFGTVLRERRAELLTTCTVALALLLGASTVMYAAERNAQPEQFGSIPRAMWWGVVTLTTVGYGDTFPVTPLGKAFAAIIAAIGIGVVAVPTGILGAGFSQAIEERRKERPGRCPTCGRAREDPAAAGSGG